MGQPYHVRLVSFDELEQPDSLALHPFGYFPIYQEGDLTLFESGSIIFHMAQLTKGSELLEEFPKLKV